MDSSFWLSGCCLAVLLVLDRIHIRKLVPQARKFKFPAFYNVAHCNVHCLFFIILRQEMKSDLRLGEVTIKGIYAHIFAWLTRRRRCH